jgi:hypothetical protein
MHLSLASNQYRVANDADIGDGHPCAVGSGVEKGSGFVRERRKIMRLVNHHPEMKGVHPQEDDLFVFESDDCLKDFVLQNNDPGTDEPFYVPDDELDQD